VRGYRSRRRKPAIATDECEVRHRPQPERDATLLGTAERAEPQEEAGQSRGPLGDRAQRVLVQRLERNRPGGDLRRMHESMGVQNVADVAEETRYEPGSEDHEHGDAVRDRAEEDRAQQRQRRDDQDAARQLEARHDDPVRPPGALEAGHEHAGEVEDQNIRCADRGSAEKSSDEQRRAPDRPDDERLQQCALRVAAHDAEREKDRQHDPEEERAEHRHAEQECTGEGARIDALRWNDVVDVMERVARADPVEDEEGERQQAHDEEHLAAQRLAQPVAGDRPHSRHDVSPPTAST